MEQETMTFVISVPIPIPMPSFQCRGLQMANQRFNIRVSKNRIFATSIYYCLLKQLKLHNYINFDYNEYRCLNKVIRK